MRHAFWSRFAFSIFLPRRAIWLGVLTAVLGLLLCRVPPVPAWEAELGLGWLFQLRGSRPASGAAVVVAIDNATFAALQLPMRLDRWPRSLHAQLVNQLAAAGAATILFDVRFTENRNDADEQLFADALLQAGNVVLITDLAQSGAGSYVVERQIPPLPLLAEAATALAPFPLPKEGRVDRLWLFKHGAGDVAILPVAALHVYARPYYPRLLELMQELAPAHAKRLPAPALLAEPGGINGLIVVLRWLLYDDPALAAALRARVHAEADPATRQVLEALIALHSGYGDCYLDFYGPARSIPMLSYHEALADPAQVAGKAVFVGFVEERYQNRQIDGFRTVFTADGVDLSGVEIAATVFENLLEGRRVAPLSPAWELTQIGVWGLVAGIAVGLLSAWRLVLVIGLLVGGLVGLAGYSFEQNGIWLPLVTNLLVQLPIALFGALLLRSAEGRRIMERLTGLLPPRLISILRGKEQALSELKTRLYAVCLSTDAASYTTLAEGMDPDELYKLLDHYYGPFVTCVHEHAGRVSDIIGDGMLALWEGADTQGTPALKQNACAALFAMRAVLAERHRSGSATGLPTRFGLHGGEIILATLGATAHREYRPIGDAVNTATRIQSFNKQLGTYVLASDDVVQGLHNVIYRELGHFLLKGKTIPVQLYELVRSGRDKTPDEVQLHRAFAAALGLFRAREWPAAKERFALLSQRYNDGPSRYYQRICEDYECTPPAADWEGVITT